MRKSRQAREAESLSETEQDEPREERRKPARTKHDRELREKVATIPIDPVNEQVVIAAAIVSPEHRKRLVRLFLPEHFHAKGHPAAWSALTEIDRRGLQYDPATVRQLSGGEADAEYLDALIAERPAVPPNLQFHVECVHTDKKRSDVREPLNEFLDALHDTTTDIDQLRRLAKRIGVIFDGAGTLRFLRDTNTVFANATKRIRERRARFASGMVGYPYGIPGLDRFEDGTPRLIPGMAPGLMTLVVGESGNGKTTVTNQLVLAQAEMQKRTLHGAWEQDGEDNLEALAAYSLGLSRAALRIGAIDDAEEENVIREMDRLRPFLTFFELPFDRSRGKKQKVVNETNLDVIHEHVEQSGCDIAIFDLFAKALVETKPDDEKRALDRMLGIAKETSTHLILLHHLNKADLRDRPDRRPTRESIKGSTAWVDAFDTIFGLYIPDKWKPGVVSNTLEMHILKQRYGSWPLAVEFDYSAATGVVTNGRSFDLTCVDADDSLNTFLDGEREEPRKKGGRRGR
jgi:replicative DNA helicase